jgi:cation diffusion facilitator CzcD-associated flavoprotein CzcO
VSQNNNAQQNSTIDLLIIGAGFSGLCMGVKAKEAGYRMRILEKGPDVGGVWRENTYPGAACDVPWYLYSFSFFKETIFSRPYPQQAEILQYQQDVARHYALYNDIDFGEEVDTAQWDATEQCWQVKCRSGKHYTARTLVSAVGVLTRPAWPDIAGLESFKGDIFHSAQWRHDIPLKGKRIGVLGSGASAVQFVPEVAREAGELTIFQRSAPYILPRLDTPHSSFKLAMFRRFPALVQGYRQAWWRYGELLTHTFKGKNIVSSFVKSLSRVVRFFAVRDPELRKKLTPDYALGCKRILFADNYYKAFKLNNVHLNTDGIDHFTETGLVDRQGKTHDLDAVILGTGFKATEFLAPMTVIGRDGQNLHASWQPIARAYLGMTVPGFPNFFMMYGPNTNLGSNSIIFMIECQANYIAQALDAIRSGKNLEVQESVFKAYNEEMQSRLAKLVWAEGCGTWYTTNEGLNPTNWPGMTREYRDRTATLKNDDFLPAT